jgi:GT2 family glycosyltransferase/SAM-dependent methyltransferase/glycosyltransferase involved in cell wall biosynthesis
LSAGAEIFERPRDSAPQDFSGERLTSAIGGQVEMEHLHRYFLARDLCRGLDVLDVACGEGYGSALLAQVARTVMGLDCDTGAIAHAEAAFGGPSTFFVEGEAIALPFADGCFDAVISFETIEHFADHEAFLLEIRRVLRPGGFLMASSPDRAIYSAPGMKPNPYHVRELTRDEFLALLRRHFPQVTSSLQRAMIGSVLMPSAQDSAAAPRVFERHENDLVQAAGELPQAPYIVAVASDTPMALPPSLFIYDADIDGHALRLDASRPGHAEESRRRLAAEQECTRLRAALERLAAASEAERGRLRRAVDIAAQNAASAEFRLTAMQQSAAWKATWPLRRLALRAPRAARLFKRVAQGAWWAATGQLPQRISWWRAARRARIAPPSGPPPRLIDHATGPDIHLPAHRRPVVSVIIPSYGQVDYTLQCLASIAAAPPRTPFEVLVAEDCSGDPAVGELRLIDHLRLLESRQNLGFLRNCNQAARQSRAEFLMFLNNDTQVQPGWLDQLVELLRRRADAGAAGAKLIYPDGRLQEAGGIVWKDASAWNYGRLDDPSAPVYNYVREADYISGAALLVRRADFEALGGFDPAYAPAYCEDSDLAFRLRAAGRKVLYQPRSVVVHFEGISHGTDLSAGLKAHQVTNQARLRDRWAGELEARHFANGTHILRARDRAFGRRIILVIDHYVPQPDRDAGSRTMLAFMQALLRAGRVVKFWTDNGAYSAGYTEALQDLGIEVVYGPSAGSFDRWIGENGADIDGVLLSRPDVTAKYIVPLRRHSAARVAYYGHDLHGARMRRQAFATGDAALEAAADVAERQECQIWRAVDVVLYPSAEEVAEVAALEPGIDAQPVVPYGFAKFGVPAGPPAGEAVLFVAGFGHPPNEDAASWFVAEIWPLVVAARPGAALHIVGSNPTAKVKALAGGRVFLAANVSDTALAEFYASARVAIVPLRYGAGVKLKVVEALARGTPLVTTPTGAQGCEGLAEVCAVHNDAGLFAAAVVRLLSDDDAWRVAARAQVGYARGRFSEAALGARLLEASGL